MALTVVAAVALKIYTLASAVIMGRVASLSAVSMAVTAVESAYGSIVFQIGTSGIIAAVRRGRTQMTTEAHRVVFPEYGTDADWQSGIG